jgi:hypothetical protein
VIVDVRAADDNLPDVQTFRGRCLVSTPAHDTNGGPKFCMISAMSMINVFTKPREAQRGSGHTNLPMRGSGTKKKSWETVALKRETIEERRTRSPRKVTSLRQGKGPSLQELARPPRRLAGPWSLVLGSWSLVDLGPWSLICERGALSIWGKRRPSRASEKRRPSHRRLPPDAERSLEAPRTSLPRGGQGSAKRTKSRAVMIPQVPIPLSIIPIPKSSNPTRH